MAAEAYRGGQHPDPSETSKITNSTPKSGRSQWGRTGCNAARPRLAMLLIAATADGVPLALRLSGGFGIVLVHRTLDAVG